MDKTTAFLISEAFTTENGFLVRGICDQGEVKLEQIFCGIMRESGNSQTVNLTVTKIITYRKEINALPTGMSAELHLAGVTVTSLEHGDILYA